MCKHIKLDTHRNILRNKSRKSYAGGKGNKFKKELVAYTVCLAVTRYLKEGTTISSEKECKR